MITNVTGAAYDGGPVADDENARAGIANVERPAVVGPHVAGTGDGKDACGAGDSANDHWHRAAIHMLNGGSAKQGQLADLAGGGAEQEVAAVGHEDTAAADAERAIVEVQASVGGAGSIVGQIEIISHNRAAVKSDGAVAHIEHVGARGVGDKEIAAADCDAVSDTGGGSDTNNHVTGDGHGSSVDDSQAVAATIDADIEIAIIEPD